MVKRVALIGLLGILLCGSYWCGLQDGLNRQPQAYFYAPQPPQPFWPIEYDLVLFDTFYLRRDRIVTWSNTSITFDEKTNHLTVEGICHD